MEVIVLVVGRDEPLIKLIGLMARLRDEEAREVWPPVAVALWADAILTRFGRRPEGGN